MLDLGLSKIAIIGVVALIVVGPERLPRVARTMGTLLGRAQRYLADVKAEVNREMQLDELRAMRDNVEKAASSFESSVKSGIHETESAFNASIDTGAAHAESMDAVMAPLAPPPEPMRPAKRKNWRRHVRERQSALPLWFKNASRRRVRVQSGAARVARYRVR